MKRLLPLVSVFKCFSFIFSYHIKWKIDWRHNKRGNGFFVMVFLEKKGKLKGKNQNVLTLE
jgi:hypothetical protein